MITLPRSAVVELERTNECLALIARIAVEANEERSIEALLHDTLEAICRLAGWPLGLAYVVAEEGDSVVPTALWHLPEDGRFQRFVDESRTRSFPRGAGLPGRGMESLEPIWIDDLGADDAFPRAAAAAASGLRTGFAIPLVAGTEVVGVLTFFDTASRPPDEVLLGVLGTAGLVLGRSIERRRTSERLRDAEQLSRRIIDSALPAFVSIDMAGEVLGWSPSAERIFGWSESEVLGRRLADFLIPPELRAAHERGLRRFLDTGEARLIGRVVEVSALHKDGHSLPIELSINTVETRQGRRFTAFLQDISERHRASEELARRERLLAEAQALARLGSWEWTVGDDRVEWSAELHRIYGTDPASFAASYEAYLARIHPDDRERMDRLIQSAFAEQRSFTTRHRIVRTDGAVRHLSARGTVHCAEDGRVLRMTGTGHDITDLVEGEERARELAAERARTEELSRLTAALERSNEELERFAYIVSHDLKAPLRGIAQTATWLGEDLGDRLDDDSRRTLDLLRGRVQRMTEMIDGILTYSRAGREERPVETVEVEALIAELADLLVPPGPATVEVASAMPVLRTERYRLQQVFHNLLDNALKHAGRDDPRIEVTWERQGAQHRFSVADDGLGIPEQHRARVFELFRTLAPESRRVGSGLGLALVKRIVERQGGQIELTARDGGGTRVSFTWPG